MTMTAPDQNLQSKPEDKEVLLSVKNVSKRFCRDLKRSLFYGVQDIAGEMFGMRSDAKSLRKSEFWALKDVCLELCRGGALGLVGGNGAGKTTLLRIISGLIRPDTGSVEVKGRVAPLIALGAGFNPILTGRENIYANMSILGLSKKEIDERFDAVVEFSEIGDAIDSPVQSYSSGMAARLGFASAIHTEPDILLIDEVLAVGDFKFQEKCRRQLYELRQKGTAFILVSHQAQVILETCPNALYLSKGRLITSGDTASVMTRYEEDLLISPGNQKTLGATYMPHKSEDESLGLDITSIFFRDAQENVIESPVSGDLTYFCVECKAHKRFENVGLIFLARELGGKGVPSFILSSFNDDQSLEMLPGKHEIRIRMPYLGLRVGTYTTRVHIRKDLIYTLDCDDLFRFTVKAKEMMSDCSFYQPRSWEIISELS